MRLRCFWYWPVVFRFPLGPEPTRGASWKPPAPGISVPAGVPRCLVPAPGRGREVLERPLALRTGGTAAGPGSRGVCGGAWNAI
jgi:hypothetical protein